MITLLSITVFLLVFALSSRLYFRLDLTADRKYSLSMTSKNLYREISDIVRITYFVSDRLVASHPLPNEITGLLREYAAYSRGKIQFAVKDPVKSGLTAEMDYLGIYPQIIRVIENNEILTTDVYTGIVIEYLERTETIPLVFSRETLEYDITSRILLAVQGRVKELGIIIGDSTKQWNTDYSLLFFELGRWGFRTRILIPGEEIPSNLPALFVLGGSEDLDAWALYRIDHYIQTGGNVLFAQKGLYTDTRSSLETGYLLDQGLLAMIASYGAAVLPALVLDRASLQIGIQGANSVSYPLWISVQDENMNRQSPVMRNQNSLCLYWASPLELAPPPSVTAEILFTSTADAWLEIRDFTLDPGNVFFMEQDADLTMGRKILGACLYGTFPCFFAGMPKPQREGSLAELPDMPVSAGQSRLIVVGDSDFAGSMMEAGGGEEGNLGFLLKAADWLSGDETGIGLYRGETGRLDRIADPVRRKAAMDFSKNFNVFAIPGFIILAGLLITVKRKRTAGSGGRGAD